MKKPKETSKQPLLPFTFLFFLILIVLIPNLYYSKAMDQQLEIRMLGLSVFLGILLLPLILIKKNALLRLADLKILKNPVVIIYAVFICIIGISVFWATNQSEAMYEFLKRVLFFILFLYLLLYILPKEESRLALIKAFVLFAISITITGIFQLLKVFTETKYNMEAIYLITGNFAQKNIFSEVLFIAFAFSIYGIAILDKIWKKAAIAASLLCFLFIAFLMTRAIWAGFLVSVVFSILLYVFYVNKSQSGDKLKKGLRYGIIIFGIVIIALLAFSLADKNKTLQHQLTNAFDFKQGSTYHRLNLWEKTLLLSKQNLLLGVGAGNWRIDILQYDLQVITEKGRIMPDRAHNDYLQVLAENGIIGLILFLLLFGLLIYYGISSLKKSNNFPDSLFILILFFAILGFMVDSAFAFPRERIELQIFSTIIFAGIVFEYHKKIKHEQVSKSQLSIRPYALLLFSLLIVGSFAAYKRLAAEVGMTKIYAYNKLNNHEQIIKVSNEIYSPFSTISPFCDPILQIRGISMYQTKKDLNQVLETYDQSMKDSPYHLETLNGLAIIHRSEKNYDKALEYNEKALKYGPSDIRARVIKSDILISMNKMEEGYQNIRSIDTSTNNQEYRKAVLNILYFKINQMMSKINNEYFGMQLNKVVEQSEVLFKIFCTSINTKEEVEKILLERVFSECDPAIISKDPSIQELKIKYKLTK